MKEVYNLLEHLMGELKNKIGNEFDDICTSIENINNQVLNLNERVQKAVTNNRSYDIKDFIDQNMLAQVEEKLSKTMTRTLSRDVIRTKTITNEITYEVEKPLSMYSTVALLRETVANIKQTNSQPQILKEVFNFCTSLTDKLFLFVEKKTDRSFLGFDGYIRDQAGPQARAIAQKLRISVDSKSIIIDVCRNKCPYIGEVPAYDADLFNGMHFDKSADISIFPMLLKNNVVAMLVFDSNVWKYAHLLDVLLVTTELKMELTFAKRKLEPHYPPLELEGFISKSSRLENRTILNQEKQEKEAPVQYTEYLEDEGPVPPAVNENDPAEDNVEGDKDDIEDIDTDSDTTREMKPGEDPMGSFDEGSYTEDEVEDFSEDELDGETEKMYIKDFEDDEGMDDDPSYTDEEHDTGSSYGLKPDNEEKTDEFATVSEEDDFSDEELDEEAFEDDADSFSDDGFDDKEDSMEETADPAFDEEIESDEEDDMEFDDDMIEGDLEDSEISPLPGELEETHVEEGPEDLEEGLSEDEKALHNEAERFAKLIVTEMKLYQPENVKKGKLNKNLYQLLKTDIDRGRSMYESRVSDIEKKKHDYYREALIKYLAAGDEDALGF